MRSRVGPRLGRTNRAFTLVEVLVSLAIFALAAVALSAAYLNVIAGYEAQDEIRRRETGWHLARVLVLTESDRDKVEAGGTVSLPDQSSLVWSTEIEPTAIADLFTVQLQVRVTGAKSWDQEARLLLFRPAWSDPGDRDRLREDSRQRIERNSSP